MTADIPLEKYEVEMRFNLPKNFDTFPKEIPIPDHVNSNIVADSARDIQILSGTTVKEFG